MHLIGYGNPGRGDDGLGPAFAEWVLELGHREITIAIDYQLTVDHALWIADASLVVFVDALMDAGEPFVFAAATSAPTNDLSSHTLTPASVMTLAATLYDAEPEAYVLGITGKAFDEVREGLSMEAEQNLSLAKTFFLQWLETPCRGLANGALN